MFKMTRRGVSEWDIEGTRVVIYGNIYEEGECLYLHWFGFDTGYVSCDARSNVGISENSITSEENELIQKIFDRIILPMLDGKLDKVIFDPNNTMSILPEWTGDLC